MGVFERMPPAVRPREKIFRLGAAALTDEELWCCILGQGNRKRSVMVLAQAMTRFGRDELPRREVLGDAQYARAAAVLELSRRRTDRAKIQVRGVRDVLFLCQDLAEAAKETVRAVYCSSRAEVLHQETLALGGLNAAYLEPKDLFYPLRFHSVDSIVLCHNHPSGDPEPSGEDIVFTQRMAAACHIMGLQLRDHVIVARGGYCSLRERGLFTDVPADSSP